MIKFYTMYGECICSDCLSILPRIGETVFVDERQYLVHEIRHDLKRKNISVSVR